MLVKAACLQNEIAPETKLNRYKNVFLNAKEDPKNDPKHVRNILSPSHAT